MNPLCLQPSADLSLPLQCRFKLDHSGGHDWEIEKDVLTDYRACRVGMRGLRVGRGPAPRIHAGTAARPTLLKHWRNA